MGYLLADLLMPDSPKMRKRIRALLGTHSHESHRAGLGELDGLRLDSLASVVVDPVWLKVIIA